MHTQFVKRLTQRWRSRKRSYLPHVKDIILCLNKIWQHSLCCSSKSQAIEAVIQPQGLSASPTTLASCLCFPLLRSTVWKFKSLTVIRILREINIGDGSIKITHQRIYAPEIFSCLFYWCVFYHLLIKYAPVRINFS